MQTKESTPSPGVKISSAENWTWKPLTPARVPRGARISAGKSGKVATSLPESADVLVSWVPSNCIPSPESPHNRTVTPETDSEGFDVGGNTVELLMLVSWGNWGRTVANQEKWGLTIRPRSHRIASWGLLNNEIVFAQQRQSTFFLRQTGFDFELPNKSGVFS